MPADGAHAQRVRETMLKAYRWQYIVSGAIHPHFQKVLGGLVSRVGAARRQRPRRALARAM